MKRFLLLCIFFAAMTCSANTIHWITFIDTSDPNVGTMDINGRLFLYNDFINKVNAALCESGYISKIYDYYGKNTTPENCKNVVSNLYCEENDIVVFYYIGHGTRSYQDVSTYPQMCLAQHNESKYIPLTWVHNTLKSKKPRLLVTIGMCCNSFSDATAKNYPTFSANKGIAYYSNAEMGKIRKMFLETSGDIILSSSKKGQFSLGTYFPYINACMDVFTYCFVVDFNLGIRSNQDLTWPTLFSAVASNVNMVASSMRNPDGSLCSQNPQWNMNIQTVSRPEKKQKEVKKEEVEKKVKEKSQGGQVQNDESKEKSSLPVQNQDELSQKLTEAFDAIIDKNAKVQIRNNYASVVRECFAQDAIVKVLAEDVDLVVDKYSIGDYMDLLATSKSYHKVIVCSVDVTKKKENSKISEIKVREYIVK